MNKFKVLLLVIFLKGNFVNAQDGGRLLKDINPRTNDGNHYGISALGDSLLVFRLSNDLAKLEIHYSDGTFQNTHKYFETPSSSSGIGISPIFKGNVYFSQLEGLNYNIWKTNGTNAGTIKISENTEGFFSKFTIMNDRLLSWWDGGLQYITEGDSLKYYFKGKLFNIYKLDVTLNAIFLVGNYNNNWGLYKINTSDGSIQLIDANSNSFPIKVFNNKLYYFRSPCNLVIYDIVSNQELNVINLNGTDVRDFTVLEGKLLVKVMNNFSSKYYEILSNDTVNLITSLDNVESLVKLKTNKYLFFKNGFSDIWLTNNIFTNAQFVKKIVPRRTNFGVSGSGVIIDSTYIFTASGDYIYRTDGTSSGTYLIDSTSSKDWSLTYPFKNFTKIKDKVFFNGYDFQAGYELLSSNGLNFGHSVLKDFNTTTKSSYPHNFYNINDGKIYFIASDSLYNSKIWVSDGTKSGTKILIDDFISDINAFADGQFIKLKDDYFFTDNYPRRYLYKYDTSLKKTSLILSMAVFQFRQLNEKFYFKVFDGNKTNIYESDGTIAGTIMLLNSDRASDFVIVNQKVFYINDYSTYAELWSFDPSNSSYLKVKTYDKSSSSIQIANSNNSIYITLVNPQNKFELWKSNGTEVGTVLLKTLGYFVGSNASDLFTNSNKIFFFLTYKNESNSFEYEEWVFDEITQVTTLVKNLFGVSNYCNCGGFTYLWGLDRNDYLHTLYKSDGTFEGTQKVLDDNFFGEVRMLSNFRCSDNNLYFSTNSLSSNGYGIYKTDGTITGTNKVITIKSGDVMTNTDFEILNKNKIIFTNYIPTMGSELYEYVINCPNNLVLSNSNALYESYNVSNKISSTQQIAAKSIFIYQAGGSMELNSGFQVNEGGLFVAEMKRCN